MKYQKILSLALLAMALSLFPDTYVGAQVAVDPDLPDYMPVEGISGSTKSIGSKTIVVGSNLSREIDR